MLKKAFENIYTVNRNLHVAGCPPSLFSNVGKKESQLVQKVPKEK